MLLAAFEPTFHLQVTKMTLSLLDFALLMNNLIVLVKKCEVFDIFINFNTQTPSSYIQNVCHFCLLKNSLIIHEENTKKNHKRVVSVYVIQIHVDLHKL